MHLTEPDLRAYAFLQVAEAQSSGLLLEGKSHVIAYILLLGLLDELPKSLFIRPTRGSALTRLYVGLDNLRRVVPERRGFLHVCLT